MWPRKRLLKKEKKQRFKKLYLISIIFSGIMGVSMMVIGVLLILNEPLFTSPIPMLQSWKESRENESVEVEIEKGLKGKSIQFTEITRESSTRYRIVLEDNGEVFIDPRKGVAEQLSSLQVILSSLTMEGKRFKRLDLTFDRPIIVLQ